MKSKKKGKKFLGTFLISLLAIVGGVTALPLSENIKPGNLSFNNFKQIQNNPTQFLKMGNLALPQNFDYIEELNKEFAKNSPYNELLEIKLKTAIQEGDYESWKDAFIRLGGSSGETGIISREEFEILKEIKKEK
jgi:hypothetical protein